MPSIIGQVVARFVPGPHQARISMQEKSVSSSPACMSLNAEVSTPASVIADSQSAAPG